MSESVRGFRARARADAEALLDAIAAAEDVIITTIERECAALRAGHRLAARALHVRLTDATKLYLEAIKAARASLSTIERVLPGARAILEERRLAFSPQMKVQLAVLAATRAAAGESEAPAHSGEDFTARAADAGRAAVRR